MHKPRDRESMRMAYKLHTTMLLSCFPRGEVHSIRWFERLALSMSKLDELQTKCCIKLQLQLRINFKFIFELSKVLQEMFTLWLLNLIFNDSTYKKIFPQLFARKITTDCRLDTHPAFDFHSTNARSDSEYIRNMKKFIQLLKAKSLSLQLLQLVITIIFFFDFLLMRMKL